MTARKSAAKKHARAARLQSINVRPKTKSDFEELRALLIGLKKRPLNQDEALSVVIKTAKKEIQEARL